jgi:hypothetical protein
VPRGAWCDLVDVSVARDLAISGTGVRVAGSTIGGGLVIGRSGRSGRGTPWNVGQCGPDTIRGNLVFTGNDASGDSIAGNTNRNLVRAGNRSVGAADNTAKDACRAAAPAERPPARERERLRAVAVSNAKELLTRR